jgi:hypothetical protein
LRKWVDRTSLESLCTEREQTNGIIHVPYQWRHCQNWELLELIIRGHGYTDEYFKPRNNLQQQLYILKQTKARSQKQRKWVCFSLNKERANK